MAELPLEDVDRHAFADEFYGVAVAELVRRYSSSDAGCSRNVTE